jgi:hypothetical protein
MHTRGQEEGDEVLQGLFNGVHSAVAAQSGHIKQGVELNVDLHHVMPHNTNPHQPTPQAQHAGSRPFVRATTGSTHAARSAESVPGTMGAGAQGRTASCVDGVVAPLVPDIAAKFALPINSAVALSSRKGGGERARGGQTCRSCRGTFHLEPDFLEQ